MPLLFWTLWMLDLLLLLLSVVGKGFRSGFGAGTDLNSIIMVACGIILAVSLYFQFSGKPRIALGVAGLPVAALLVLYLIDQRNGK